ncbi:MFS transporter [Hippea maritima]|uniref:Major facilitator superfamily MFS_1 n=1 Tax=Hippea maritima (strain ATCC 700847 / DSM 10411 / MH2) TaxID=760142 RepID=F2LTZ9_HIPMA|nr:MFS transporter [Hippea maritima]AEA33398.1 major facilitator superfamily MFS_1 [Hippea maritima DSM 10411]
MRVLTNPFFLLISIALAHFVNDWYSLLIAPAIPLIKKSYGINYLQSGMLLSVPYFLSAILQAPIAHFSENYAKRKTVLIGGFLILSLSYLLFYLSNSYYSALFATILIGIGLGTYHPQGMGILSSVFKEKKGMAIGLNGVGGALGYFFAPISMGYLLSLYGTKAFLIVSIPGFVIAVILFIFVKIEEQPIKTSFKSTITKDLLMLGLVAIVIPFFSRGISSFLPAYFYANGSNILDANLKASVMLLAGLIAQPLGGAISDKIGRKQTISISYFMMGVFLALFISKPSLIFLFFMGFFMSLSIPVRHAFAAEVGGKKVNSNIAVVFGMVMVGSSIAPSIVGALADHFGFKVAFGFNVAIAIAGSLLVWAIKKPHKQA